MNKISKLFKSIVEIIKQPALLNNVLNDDSVWEKYVIKKYKRNIGLPIVDINNFLSNSTETLNHFAFLDGGSMPTDIALLKSLSKRFDKCKYFEIGTWRGESVVNVAEVADECYTLCLSKKELLSLGFSERYADLHGFFSKDKDNIKQLTGDSTNFDFEGLNQKFDLIFIDGNHHFDYVKQDTINAFKHLIHDKSIIVWHDYAYNPEKYRPEIMAAILDGVPLEFQKNIYHVSNSMCAIFTREHLLTEALLTPISPDKVFKVSLQAKKI